MQISLPESNKEKAFKKLYEEFYAPFCLYAKRFIDDATVREDIVSDVFASLWDKQNTFELKQETILGYLKMCVRNNCLNYLRRQEYEWSYADSCQKREPIYATAPDSVYTLNELYKMLYDTLNKLPESCRIVFTKNFFEGKTHAEIARDMNLSIKTVDRYKKRTMDFLRSELKDYLPFMSLILLR